MTQVLQHETDTLDWLLARRRDGGMPVVSGGEEASPGATALLVLAVLELEQPRLAEPSIDWLLDAYGLKQGPTFQTMSPVRLQMM